LRTTPATSTSLHHDTSITVIYTLSLHDALPIFLGADCSLRVQLPTFDEALLVTQWQREGDAWVCEEALRSEPPAELEAIYSALLLGLRDYLRKNGFPGIVIGMSGGIDSALSAAIAVDALRPEKVWCVM